MLSPVHFDGVVTHVPLSGGFWGLVADHGERFRPMDGIPEDLQVEGQRVRVKARHRNIISIHMWGTAIELLDIKPI